jgi:hypothetical protein
VLHPHLVCNVGDAGFVADEDDLDVVPEFEPTLKSVPLDVPDVADERLRNREERQHAGLVLVPREAATEPAFSKVEKAEPLSSEKEPPRG